MSAKEFGVESFTGIRPTADLTVANFIGAIQPILEQEAQGETQTAVFLAELHAATTSRPTDVLAHSEQLARTLVASGVQGEIYSQFSARDLVAQTEFAIRGLTSVARILRLPALKEKVNSDKVENASVALAMYPMMMAADIILARPQFVPTGKDQKSHLEVTNELIRAFNREYGADLPEPLTREITPVNIGSLDGSGRKMSKSIPRGAIFLDDSSQAARKKIMSAPTASEPGPDMDMAVNNLITIANGLSVDEERLLAIADLGARAKRGDRVIKGFKDLVGDVVVTFLEDLDEKRSSVSSADVKDRVSRGDAWFRPIATETLTYMEHKQWDI